MDATMLAVAESLAGEFRSERPVTVMEVVDECVQEYPEVDPFFIEQASRARLKEADGGHGGRSESPRRP